MLGEKFRLNPYKSPARGNQVVEEKLQIGNHQIKIAVDDSKPGVFTWDLSIMTLDGRKMFSKDFHSAQPFSTKEGCVENAKYVAQNWIERNP
tara:strand:- start:139 stop:414 length:276 start_codon:yes stop_codon:yes gene_type:complete